jgi:hypothetical protein
MQALPPLPAGNWPPDVHRAYSFLLRCVQQGENLLSRESSESIRYCSASERLAPYADFRNPLIATGLDEEWVDLVMDICADLSERLRAAGDAAFAE